MSTHGVSCVDRRAEPLRAARVFGGILLIAAAVVVAAAFAAKFFTWNLTPSLPRGLYVLRPKASPERGTIVLFPIPESVRQLVVARHYLPAGARLLKIVVALAGDYVCVDDTALSIGGRPVAAVRRVDSLGRRLEPSSFCGRVPPGEAFVATPAVLSFDSRYFGPVPISVLTVARPLWTF